GVYAGRGDFFAEQGAGCGPRALPRRIAVDEPRHFTRQRALRLALFRSCGGNPLLLLDRGPLEEGEVLEIGDECAIVRVQPELVEPERRRPRRVEPDRARL